VSLWEGEETESRVQLWVSGFSPGQAAACPFLRRSESEAETAEGSIFR